MRRVSLEGVDGTVMFAGLKTESGLDLDSLSLVGLENVTLLGTDKVLQWTSILVVLERGTTEDLGYRLVIDLEGLRENKLIYWAVSELLHVPPEDASVSRGRNALCTRLTDGQPIDVVDGIVVRLFKQGGLNRLDRS